MERIRVLCLALASILVFAGAAIVAAPSIWGDTASADSLAAADDIAAAGHVDAAGDVAATGDVAAYPFYPQALATLPNPASSPTSALPPAERAKLLATPTPYRPRDTVWNAQRYAENVLGPTQYHCIDLIFTRESHWDPRAVNRHSGAYGIPQAKPGSKMRTFGSNWRYSPLTQVKWGIWYVNARYGSACNAYHFMQAHGWY